MPQTEKVYLLIDSDPVNQVEFTWALSEGAANVVPRVAQNVDEALDAISAIEVAPEVIFVNADQPDLNLFRLFARFDNFAAIPVVVVAANNANSTLRRIQNRGGNVVHCRELNYQMVRTILLLNTTPEYLPISLN